jgi:transcriptional regulator with XRE-family HTH domain
LGRSLIIRSFKYVINEIKSKKGYSIAEIARMTKLNRTTIEGYLNGRIPSPKNRKKVALGLFDDRLLTAGYTKRTCKECGTSFSSDQHPRIFCSKRCGNRAVNERNRGTAHKYMAARVQNDNRRLTEAVQNFCDWCTGGIPECPDKQCRLAPVSPYNYDDEQLTVISVPALR